MSSMLPVRLWRTPQNVWARKAMFQIHLWSGIGIGIYILLISLSGSLLIFQAELHRAFDRPPLTLKPSGPLLTDDQLTAVAEKAYPNWSVSRIWRAKDPNQAVEIWLDQSDSHLHRIFNPFTGADLGHSVPAASRIISWLTEFHDNLLYGETGRKVNGFGAILLTVLCITGAIIWWPGITAWRRSLVAPWTGNWRRFNWGVHSVIGFWTFVFVLIWGISGIYLVYPDPFTAIVEYVQPTSTHKGVRSGDEILGWVARLHFGRFAGWPVKTLWFVLGFAPIVLFITGAVMWWNRVLKPARDLE